MRKSTPIADSSGYEGLTDADGDTDTDALAEGDFDELGETDPDGTLVHTGEALVPVFTYSSPFVTKQRDPGFALPAPVPLVPLVGTVVLSNNRVPLRSCTEPMPTMPRENTKKPI